MAVSAELKEFVQDLFSPLGDITLRSMMGGQCIYHAGQIFAIISSDERVYLKAKGALADALAEEGSEKFSMTRKDGSSGTMGYWTLPDAALDDPETACDWARRALADL